MRIGVDASRITNNYHVGTETYFYYLLKELSQIDTSNEYILYFKEAPEEGFFLDMTSSNERFSYKVVASLGSWTQVGLAIECLRNAPDILFCPWHTIPGINPFWKMKIVASIHDLTGRCVPTFWTIKFADKLIAVSNATKDKIISKYGIDSSKIKVVYEGFDSSHYYKKSAEDVSKAKDKYGIEGDYVFFLGSIGPRKNIENMIEAFSRIDTSVKFVLGGGIISGNEHIASLPADFIGKVDQEDLPALYSGARFFSFVSKEEGFGIPILEAMACGIPVLTSNVSSTKEVVGNAALLVDPNSVDSISDGMQKLLNNKSSAESLVEKGRIRIKDFSWKKAARETLAVFEEVGSGT